LEILSKSDLRKFGEVRLVGDSSNEIVSISDAWNRAEDDGLNLVLVSDQATPPVVRIQDFRKLEYERKKARKAQKKSSSSSLKEIQFKINISDHDLQTKVNKAMKFLEKGDKVKVVVRLKGRERDNPQRAWELIERVAEQLPCKMTKGSGPIAMATLEPEKQ
jgi:translation initiation factor IF-3